MPPLDLNRHGQVASWIVDTIAWYGKWNKADYAPSAGLSTLFFFFVYLLEMWRPCVSIVIIQILGSV